MSDRRNILEMFEEQKEYMEERVNSGIEKYRKGDVRIVLKDNCGGVISNAKIKVKQKSHEFKFGANLFMLEELETEEKNEFLMELGVSESGIDQLIKTSYALLGLKTFFTAGEDECRAWTFKNGMKAPECAGIIHTDFQKGFIKAEVMSYEDLERLGSEKAVQEAGKLRLEGKEYVMQDGDICFFRFNVTK